MAKTPSSMCPLGTQAPAFALMDAVSGNPVVLDQQHAGAVATVIMFICNHCPYVRHYHEELPRLARDYMPTGVRFIAINSNNIEQYPDDSPENMKKAAQELHYPFPYLFDETQEVARAYQAQCTPDFFVFDHNLALAYRGQLDDSRLGNHRAADGASIRATLDCLIAKQPVPLDQKPSLGCSIKWKQTP